MASGRNHTPAAIAGRKRYAQSAKGKAYEARRRRTPRHRLYNREYSKTPNGRYNAAKAHAKHRGIFFELTKPDYFALINSNCYYCGGQLNKSGVGLDRLDSRIGYTQSNCVPACRGCNVIKSDLLTPAETLAVIGLLAQMRGGVAWSTG